MDGLGWRYSMGDKLENSWLSVVYKLNHILPPMLCGLGIIAIGTYLRVNAVFWLGLVIILVVGMLNILTIALEFEQRSRRKE